MTGPEVPDLREIEQFVYREARYADEHDYDAWEALWTDDALYWVPAGGDLAEPGGQMSVIYDNRNRITTRLNQLRTGRRYAQSPPSGLGRPGHLPAAPGGRRAPAGRQAGPAGQPRPAAAYPGVPDLTARPEEEKVPVVDSEFADVSVEVDTAANGPRLRLEDRRSGRVRFLDALELEAIVWLPEGHLTRLLDPSADRWRDA